jgi:cell division protein ZipA
MVEEPYLPTESWDEPVAEPELPSHPEPKIPTLIEFSIVARADEGFNGEVLFDAMEDLGLEYGTNQVFERLDSNRLVDFTVASMVADGTFPSENLGSFFSPGIVFFMQPRELEYPDDVFEDFVQTIQQLAEDLDGVAWDNQRQPLGQDTIDYFRSIFKHQA